MENTSEKVRGLWTESTTFHPNMKQRNYDFDNSRDVSTTNLDGDLNREPYANDFNKKQPRFLPRNTFNNNAKKKKWLYACTHRYKPPKRYKYLWIIISLTSAITVDVNMGLGGIDLEISVFDAIIMLSSSILLIRGFDTQNNIITVPWTIMFFWSLYACHYLTLIQLIRTFAYTEDPVSILMAFTYWILIVSLALKFVLWIKVVDFLYGADFTEKICYWIDLLDYMSNKVTWVYDTTKKASN